MTGLTVFVDTRQKAGKHAEMHAELEALGCKMVRTKLYVGDYQLVGGDVAVDTKQSIQELAQDLRQQHERFRDELERARDAGVELWVLVETDEVRNLGELERWTEPEWQTRRRRGAKAPIDGAQLAKACRTMQEKYGCKFAFTRPETCARNVLWVLAGEGPR